LTAGSDLFIGAIPNMSGIGSSPIALAVSDGTNTSLLYDKNSSDVAVRAVHNAVDVPAVDIFAAADTTNALDVTDFTSADALYSDVSFPAISLTKKWRLVITTWPSV